MSNLCCQKALIIMQNLLQIFLTWVYVNLLNCKFVETMSNLPYPTLKKSFYVKFMLPKGLKNYTKFATKFLNMGLTSPPFWTMLKKTADLAKDGTPYRTVLCNKHFPISTQIIPNFHWAKLGLPILPSVLGKLQKPQPRNPFVSAASTDGMFAQKVDEWYR